MSGLFFGSDIQLRRNVQFMRNGRSVFFALTYALCQQILYLSIHRSKVILGPGCDGVIELGGQAQRHLFLGIIRHLVETAGVDNGLGIPIAAQHHQKVGYHGCLAFLVQCYDLFFGEAFQGHFHHAHRAVHDHLACVNDG